MKLYDSPYAPNPRRVRIFLREKGLSVPTVSVDIGAQEHRTPAYAAVNPLRRTPALVLDDGEVITESIAICRYFEHLHPAPPLFGTGALESARVEMWQRRLELSFLIHVANAYRHSHPAAKALEIPQIAELAVSSRPKALEFLEFLDFELASRQFIAGAYSVADITGLVSLDFLRPARITLPEGLKNVRRWHADLSARPSAKA